MEDGRFSVADWPVGATSSGPAGPSKGTFLVHPSFTTTTTIPQKRKPEEIQDSNTDSIDCICGFNYDDGSLSIACDDCERWCHAACFDIVEGEVPDQWQCWECLPRPMDIERAVRIQKERQKQLQGLMVGSSPGVEKKPRRASAAAIEGSKRKRRPSILSQNHNQPQVQRSEDEHVDITEPWNLYVPITQDIIPHKDTREKLERAAHSWRGITALQVSEEDLRPPRTTIQPLPASSFSHPTLSLCTNPSVRPPSFSVHTAEPVRRSRMIAPFPSTIIPSSAYLSDTLNAYAHLGIPKPFVHLVGPPLDLALDSRITGDSARFVRNGCKPNAVLRPMICPTSKDKAKRSVSSQETLAFGVFALRDLKANEEVVLGWEWDDGHAVHNLPALVDSPQSFQPHHIQYLRNQMTSMLNSLSSTFMTCACGAKATDCALNMMAAFVDGELPSQLNSQGVHVGPLVGSTRGFRTRERIPFSGGMAGVEMVPDIAPVDHATNVIGVNFNGRHAVPDLANATRITRKKVQKATTVIINDDEHGVEQHVASAKVPNLLQRRYSNNNDSVPPFRTVGFEEDKMPPKMRKSWIHRSSEALRTARSHSIIPDEGATDDEAMEVDPDTNRMPPPPLPFFRQQARKSKPSSAYLSISPPAPDAELSFPPNQDISPSTHFANLSLLSPIVDHQRSKESFPFNLLNPLPLSRNTLNENNNKGVTSSRTSPAIVQMLLPTQNDSPNETTLVQPIPSSTLAKTPSPFRLLSPIDGNGLDSESGKSAAQQASDSPQILLSLPNFARNKAEDDSHEHSGDPTPLPSQPPTIPPSPSQTHSPSPPPAFDPPPDPAPVQLDPPPELSLAEKPSPAPQKSKISFKDFSMRKQRQREQQGDLMSPLNLARPDPDLLSSGLPNSDDHSGGQHEISNSGSGDRSTELLDTRASPSIVMDALVVADDAGATSNLHPDSTVLSRKDLSSSSDTGFTEFWIQDTMIDPAGLVVRIKNEYHKRDIAGVQGVVKAVVLREGMSPLVILKPYLGTDHDGVPVGYTMPVAPRRSGDAVAIIGGKYKGEIGVVVEIMGGAFLVRLNSSGSLVNVREEWTCWSSKESEVTRDDQPASQQQVSEEDGEIAQEFMSRQTATSEIKQPTLPLGTPTQPRSFIGLSPSSKPPPPPATVPTQPSNSRPPSGPKALRAVTPKNAYPQSPFRFGTNPSGNIPQLPRGPSADREREWSGSSWSSRRPPAGWR